LQTTAEWLETKLRPELEARSFAGYFGIDALVCRDGAGELKIKPMVELNPRMTMGHVARQLGKSVSTGVESQFRVLTKATWQELHQSLDSVAFERSRDGRWKSGVLWLGEVGQHTKLVPALLIGKQALSALSAQSLA